MNFVEAWPEIKRFLLEAVKAEPEAAVGELPVGSGDVAVTDLERKLGRAVPEEFGFYMRHNPFSSYDYIPFYQAFELFDRAELSFDKSETWDNFSEAEDIISTPLVIGEDTSIAFVTDLDDVACPVYRIDEVNDWVPERMAFTLADLFYLLSYREMLYQRSFAKAKTEDVQETATDTQEIAATLTEKIEEMAPGCSGAWA